MKKILLSTIVLTLFSLSVLLFEVSCKKTANADSLPYILTPATTSKLGGVIPDGSTITVDNNGKISAITSSNSQANKIIYFTYGVGVDANGNDIVKMHSANYDGTDVVDINPVIPAPWSLCDFPVSISPDHKTIFFTVTGKSYAIYSCNIDGSNTRLVSNTSNPTHCVAY